MPDARRLEPEFVGASRRQLVAGLRDLFDTVNTGGGPRWVSLEAPSGAGKTRVVREFYATLAAQRQSTPAYWPASILGAASGDVAEVGERRKRMHPEVVERPGGSLPDWFWWGITCGTRSGSPSAALAQDLRQLSEHEQWLEARWRTLATRRERRRGLATAAGKAVGEEVIAGSADKLVEAALGQAVPGLGLAMTLGRWAVGQIGEARERSRVVGRDATINTVAGGDIVDDTAFAVTRLARPGLPVVLPVEDLHLADEALLDLIDALLRSDAAVLVITTCWPGRMEHEPPLHRLLTAHPDRLVRVRHDAPTPPGLPDGAGLGQLPADDLASVVRFYLPDAPVESIRLLVERYPNPLPLELACTVHLGRRRRRSTPTTLSPGDITTLPATIEELYREIWRGLPKPVQEGLVLAAWGVPASIGGVRVAGDDRWDRQLLRAVVRRMFPDADDLVDALDAAPTAYAWAREVDAVFRRFHEPVQREVALTDPTDLFVEADRTDFYTEIAAHLAGGLGDPTTEVGLHRAQTALALFSAGFTVDAQVVLDAGVLLARALSRYPRELPRVIEVADLAQRVDGGPPGPRITLDDLRGYALAELGRAEEAVAVLRGAVEAATAHYGPDHLETLLVRRTLSTAVSQAGRPVEAIALYRELLATIERVHGPEHEDAHKARNNLANCLVDAGRPDEAVPLLEGLCAVYGELHGETATTTMVVRENLAHALSVTGRIAEALEMEREVLQVRTEAFGPEDPRTLNTANNIASMLSSLGRFDESIAMSTTMLERMRRVLGPDHPDTLIGHNNLASALNAAGRYEEAAREHAASVAHRTRVLGPDHPVTLLSRNNEAHNLAIAGQSEQALTAYEDLVADYLRICGPDDIGTLRARANLGELLGNLGRWAESEAMVADVCDARTRILGPEHPDTLYSRYSLAYVHFKLGRPEAVAELESIAAVRIRLLGPKHPNSLLSRGAVAWAHAQAGRPDALAAYRELLADAESVVGPHHPQALSILWDYACAARDQADYAEAAEAFAESLARYAHLRGPDHSETQAARWQHACALRDAGRYPEAVVAYTDELAVTERLEGPDSQGAFVTRFQIAHAVHRSGHHDEAVARYTRLGEDLARIRGADDPDAMDTRRQSAGVLHDAGRYAEAVALLEPLVADQTRVLGPTDARTLVSRLELGTMLRLSGRLAEALAEIRAAADGFADVLGADHADTMLARYHLAMTAENAGEYAMALPLLEASIADFTKTYGADYASALAARSYLASALAGLGRSDEAARTYLALADDYARVHPDDPEYVEWLRERARSGRGAGTGGDAGTGGEAGAG